MTIDGDPWFVGKDVALALRFKDTVNALKAHVDEDDKRGWQIATPSRGRQTMTIINESGLYALIFGSKLESAKRFKRWVTSEVLPSIRKTGAYRKQSDDMRERLAEMVLAANRQQLECLKQLYPEYFSKRAAKLPSTTSFYIWKDEPKVTKDYICSFPTVTLYRDYTDYCDSDLIVAVGKKTFYRLIENDFHLTRRQRTDGNRYFVELELDD